MMNTNMEAIVWAMHSRGLDPVQWKILMKLAGRVNSERRDFDVWPSNRQIAEDCEISVATVKRHMPVLVEEGYIKILPQTRRDGSTSSNRIRLLVRTKHTMPKGREVDINADSMDRNLAWGVAQSEPPPRVTGEPCNEPLESRTYSNEPLPPSSDEEGTPTGLLFDDLPEDRPRVPLEEQVRQSWEALKKKHPGVARLDILSPARVKKIAARAGEVVASERRRGVEITPEEVWAKIFEQIPRSAFLTGRAPPGKGRTTPLRLRIDYVLRPTEFFSIWEGAYDDGERHGPGRSFDAGTGRQFGPAESAARRAIGRLHVAEDRRA